MAAVHSRSKQKQRGRSPCLSVVTAFGLGIAAGQVVSLWRPAIFLASAVLLGFLFAGRRNDRVFRPIALLLLFALLGLAAHHAAWHDRGPDSIVRRLCQEPRLARVSGTVASAPTIDRRRDAGRKAAWPLEDQSRVLIDVTTLSNVAMAEPQAVSGRIQLTTAGHLVHVGPGDHIEFVGWLSLPRPAMNPGGFDAETFFRRRGIDAIAHVDHPDGVRRIEAPDFHWLRGMSEHRDRIAALFAELLGPGNGPVGSAMILGDRSSIPIDVRDAYVASGAMHILSISGLHVGILALLLSAIGRGLNVPPVATGLWLSLTIWLYALFTGLDPPVVRASLFLSLWGIAGWMERPARLLNVTAATALVLLVWNPLWLFDVGAQLSFLAVLGMCWAPRMLPRVESYFRSDPEQRGPLLRMTIALLAVQPMAVGVWIFTAPLLATEFGIVSPVGFLLNIPLIPFVTVVMWIGYAFFAICLILPAAAGPFATLFDLGLSGIDWLVATAGNWPPGHATTPGSPLWWVAGIYVLLFASLVRPSLVGGKKLRTLSLLLAWIAVGLAVTMTQAGQSRGELRIVALDAGHGSAVLVETPNGATLLFDCGSMEDDRRVAEAAWHALGEAGGTSLDAALLSHADLDHYNNVAALLRRGPVGSILIGRSFLDFEQSEVAAACDAARGAGVPIRLVATGDRLRLDPAVEIELLHPPDRASGEDDNANSIVLRIAYAGRTILLTGDVEGPGQEELFARHPVGGFDLVVSPHHGGLKANTPEFADWAEPGIVFVSCSDRVNAAVLREIYAGSRVFLTSEQGAITAQIGADGEMTVTTALDGETSEFRSEIGEH